MKCPKCDGILNKVTISVKPEYGAGVLDIKEMTPRIEMEQCYGCNGIWFDENGLEQYLNDKLFIVDAPKSSKSSIC